ncbi:MAG: hypothetical protein ABWZ90_05550 [Acidimicrobiales bacterium]
MSEPAPTLHLPARDIPIPTSVSPEAQAVLAMPALPVPERPPVDDVDGWRTMIADHDEAIAALMAERSSSAPVTTEERDVGGVRVYDIPPDDLGAGRPAGLSRHPRGRVHLRRR